MKPGIRPPGSAVFLVLALAVIWPAVTAAAAVFSAAELPAVPAPLAARGLLLGVARAGDRLVAVGDQGVIVTSDDQGRTWSQVDVPVSTFLTAVSFADAQHGWAAGHQGVILRTSDAGRTWVRVPVAVEEDASFLDLLALTPDRILAAGAYGLLMRSGDHGDTWEKLASPAGDLHLNGLSRDRDGGILLAGEGGTLAVSRDDGTSWTVLPAPYDGSFYGLHRLASGRLLAHGLRGHVYTSDDDGATWSGAAIGPPVLLMSAVEMRPGLIVSVGLGGHLFVSHDDGTTFAHLQPAGLNGTAAMVAAGDGALIAAGESGVQRVELR